MSGNLELISLATKTAEKVSTKARESKWKDGGSWDGVFTNWSAIPWADVKQNPNIMSCHCRFGGSMFCLASSGAGFIFGDSNSVVCEGCDGVGGKCDDAGRSGDLDPKIERRNALKRWTMFMLMCRFCCSMFCLATTGTGVGDSRSVVCGSCGCAGGGSHIFIVVLVRKENSL